MPVYWRTDTSEQAWWYRFQVRGRRVHERAAGANTRREAERVEADRWREVREELDRPAACLDLIAGRWWSEVGQHRRDRKDVDYRLANIVEGLGVRTLIGALDFNAVSAFVAQRRAQPTRHGSLPSAATVNREISLLRTVLCRADKWGHAVRRIDWGALMLPEPEERVIEIRIEDQDSVFAQMPEDWRRLFLFLVVTGWRVGAACDLRWNEVGALVIERPGKGARLVRAQIDSTVATILQGQRGAHPTHVFAMAARRTLRGRTARGVARPVNGQLARNELHRACDAAGIARMRVHDLRHTAASRMLRATDNLKIVQALLSHSRITTTARYAHLSEDDAVREAMERTMKRTRGRTGNV